MAGNIRDKEFQKFKETPAGKTAVRVCVDSDTPVPVVLSAGGGAAFFADAQTLTTPGVEQTLITTTVPVGKIRHLSKVIVSCSTRGAFVIEAGGSVIGSGRTGAAEKNTFFEWVPRREVAAGVTIDIKHTAASGVASDIEAYLMAADE